jgi:hypothetical protein
MKILKNKYWLITIAFLVIFLFFDSYNLFRQIKLKKSIAELEDMNLEYQDNIKELDQKLEDAKENKERIAREKYLYKEKDEDLIIIYE